jgi:hypothetical protein
MGEERVANLAARGYRGGGRSRVRLWFQKRLLEAPGAASRKVEAIYLVCGARRPQLKRNPLGVLPMNPTDWEAITRDLRGDLDPARMAAAAAQLHSTATTEDIPRLRELLGDESFFVREAAAWPLAELAGADYLAELLGAYQRGLDDGHDNDGFTAALIKLAESDPVHVAEALQPLARSSDDALRENAQWLLTFCAPKQDA